MIFFNRKIKNKLMLSLLFLLVAIALLPLLFILFYIIDKGINHVSLDFFLKLPAPVGESGGGMANAFKGSLILIIMASLLGVPLGILSGIYLSEYGVGFIAKTLRIATDLLTSIPSIVIGLFAYALIVLPMKTFSAHAGAFALAIIMFPIVTRTTEEILKLMPSHIREAGLALGLPRWKIIIFIVLRGSIGGIATGVMLAVARIAGETAPLLFTAFNNQFAFRGLKEPISSLPVQIYSYATSPFEQWHNQAWAGAFVLVFMILIINLTTRLILKQKR